MKCIDFDKAFSRFAMQWFPDHAKDYKNYDEMEAAMPDVYARFLDTPADFLANAKPGEYFAQWDDAKALIDWMEDYFKQRVPVGGYVRTVRQKFGGFLPEPCRFLERFAGDL